MSELENKSISLLALSLSPVIKIKLVRDKMDTIENISVLDLLSLNYSLFEVVCIKEALNMAGHHFVGEELIDICSSDYSDPERETLLKYCDRLIEQRNKIRGKEGFQAEEIVLWQQILGIFEQVKALRKAAKTKNPEQEVLGKSF